MNADEFALFLEVCGMQGPLDFEVLEPGKPKAQRYSFSHPALIFGRHEQCDLCLNDPMVSRRHAYLQVIAGRVFVIDLGSRTGIISESEMLQSGWLDPGRQLRIGGCTLRLALSAMDQAPLQSAIERSISPLDRESFPSDLDLGWTLEPDTGQPSWRLNRVLTLIGRAANCKVRIEDINVSRYHAALLQTPHGVWLIDLCSHKGTFLNGRPIRRARLEDGSQLRIGEKCTIRVWQPQDVNFPLSRVPAARATPRTFRPPGPLDVVPISPAHLPRPAPPADAERLPAVVTSSGNHSEHSQLMSIIQQLSLMQQHMFDQFHQTLLTMAQMFCTMQREQMTHIRQELDRVQQLTGELRELQETLNKQVSRDSEVAAAGRNAPASRSNADASVIAAPNGLTVESTLPEGTAANPLKAPEGVSERSDTDVHAWISQRIAALQGEHQGRLSKVIGMILGKG